MTIYYYPGTAVNGFSSLYGGATLTNNLECTFTGGFEAVGVQPSSPPVSGATISVNIWSPGPASVSLLVQDSSFSYHVGAAVNLVAGNNALTMVVPAGITVITVGFQANNYTGTLLLSNLGWATANVVTVTNPGSGAGNVGSPVSEQISAMDSAAGQTLTFTASGLPAGLSISSSGLITGTPTTAGTSTVTVTATDTTSAFGSTTFSFAVAAARTVTVANPGSQALVVGTAFSLQVSATDSVSGTPLTFTASGLPAGLSISSSGLVTGTPTTAGTSTPTVTATDPTTAHGSASFSLVVASAVTGSGSISGGFSTAAVGPYELQVNEFNSGAALVLGYSNPPAAFTVSNSAVSVATNGEPAAYSSFFSGNHWGTISPVDPFPLKVSAITAGQVTTSVAGTLIGSGSWDYAYDIWFVPTPTGTQTGTDFEMMVWLNHEGSVQPAGSVVASGVTIGGNVYNVWWSGTTLTYAFATGVTSVANLDLFPLIQYAVSAGYLNSSWYLIDVECGFELWQGGTGLKVNSFSVSVGSPAPPPPANTVTVANPGSQAATVGTPYSLALSATDSASGKTISFTAAGLPPGLAISSNGVISGTPSAAASASVSVTATDNTGAFGITSFAMTVSAASGGGSGTNPPPSGASVTVDFRTPANGGPSQMPIDPLGAGLVITEFGGNPVPVVSNNGGWKQTLAALAPGHCRCSIAWYGGNPGYGAGGSSRTPGSATALIQAIQSVGAIPLVSYNGDSTDNGGLTAANGAALVVAMSALGVKYFSVGNEPEVSGPTPAFGSIIPAMAGAASGVVIGAPAAAFWDTGLLESVVGISGLRSMSYHAYDALDSAGSDNGGGGYFNTSQYFNQTGTMRGFQGGLFYGVEEFNANSNAGSSATMAFTTSVKNTLWVADVLGQLLSSGAHGTVYGDSNSGLSVISDGSGGLPSFGTPMPAYWGIGIWTGMNGQFKRWSANAVSCTTTFPNTSISAYACDNGKIVLVNKDTVAHAVTIAMGGKTSGTYNVNATQGSPPTAIRQIVTGAAYSGSEITYTVPANTAVSIDVT